MKKNESESKKKAVRDSATGRFLPGNRSGGRPKAEIPASILKSKPLDELIDIAKEARACGRLDVAERVYERLAEYVYGKPKQELDIDARADVSADVIVKFKGVLDAWSS